MPAVLKKVLCSCIEALLAPVCCQKAAKVPPPLLIRAGTIFSFAQAGHLGARGGRPAARQATFLPDLQALEGELLILNYSSRPPLQEP